MERNTSTERPGKDGGLRLTHTSGGVFVAIDSLEKKVRSSRSQEMKEELPKHG